MRGHSARVEVARDGSAVVRHELQLKIRGGPMKSLEMSGIGTDIEALPDAYVRRAAQGSAGRWPVHLSSMEDGALRLKISAERGLRGGNYVFVFGYQTSLQNKEIEIKDDRVFVSWVGPRLSSGVDSAKVTFVVPHGEQAPMLASATEGLNENVLLGEVRRGAEFDEVDLVRAHLSTGEPAVWRIAVSPEVLGGLPSSSPVHSTPTTAPNSGGWSPGFEPKSSFGLSQKNRWIVLGAALLYGLLLLSKGISVTRLGVKCDAKVLPLIPMHPIARSLLGAGLVGGLVWAILLQRLVWALSFLALALVVATFLLPVRRVRPRGPGNWTRIEGLTRATRQALPGAWFDVRSLKGCLLLLSLLGSLLACSYVVLPQSNYLALMTLLGLPLLLPIFWTGNRKDFPFAPLAQALPWQRYLARAIDVSQAEVEIWGRSPLHLDRDPSQLDVSQPAENWDEVRVRLVLPSAPSGLRAMEIVLEEKAGAHVAPCVLVRALEDSVALRRLPSDLPWQRGRSPEERVALLRPTAPTPAQTARLVKLLIKALRHGQVASPNTTRRSSGKSQVRASRPAVGMAM